MLIRRTITKPQQKLDLLLQYLKENQILPFASQKVEGVVSLNYVYIQDSLIIKILGIDKATLKSWDKRYNLASKEFDEMRSYFHEINPTSLINYKLHTFSKKETPIFYSVSTLLYFLNAHVKYSNHIKKSYNPDFHIDGIE